MPAGCTRGLCRAGTDMFEGRVLTPELAGNDRCEQRKHSAPDQPAERPEFLDLASVVLCRLFQRPFSAHALHRFCFCKCLRDRPTSIGQELADQHCVFECQRCTLSAGRAHERAPRLPAPSCDLMPPWEPRLVLHGHYEDGMRLFPNVLKIDPSSYRHTERWPEPISSKDRIRPPSKN